VGKIAALGLDTGAPL